MAHIPVSTCRMWQTQEQHPLESGCMFCLMGHRLASSDLTARRCFCRTQLRWIFATNGITRTNRVSLMAITGAPALSWYRYILHTCPLSASSGQQMELVHEVLVLSVCALSPMAVKFLPQGVQSCRLAVRLDWLVVNSTTSVHITISR